MNNMTMSILTLSIFLLVLMSSCLHSNNDIEVFEKSEIQQKDELSDQSLKRNLKIEVPINIIPIHKIKHSDVPLRVGPSSEFSIKNQLMRNGTEVLIVESSGKWRKIITLDLLKKGWIHKEHLIRVGNNSRKLNFDSDLVPMVTTKHKVSLLSINSKNPVKVEFENQSNLISLYKKKDKFLVWEPKTKHFMWVKKSDVK